MFLTLLETLKSDFRPNLRVHDLNCCRRLAFAFQLNTLNWRTFYLHISPFSPVSMAVFR